MKKRMLALLALACMLAFGAHAGAESAPADGLYSIGLSSSARMFRVVDCVLRVEDGRMTAVLTMSSSGYGYLYQGTSAEADAAPMESWTGHTVDEEGRHVFAIEIPALDQDIDMASWSIRYEKWYDRTLHFYSNTLADYNEIAPDGVYAGVIRSNTELNGTDCLLRSADGRMSIEAEGLSMELASLDKKTEIEGGWLILDSDTLETYALTVEDGVYRANVTTDSGLLRIADCILTVQGGRMTALITAGNNNFDYLYSGMATDAPGDEAGWIAALPDSQGAYTYMMEIPSLDNEIPLATYSAKKKMWYDRTITLDASTLERLN